MTSMVLQYPAIPGAAPVVGAPGFKAGPVTPAPQLPLPPRPPAPGGPRRSRRWLGVAAVVVAGLAVAGGAFAAGRGTAPTPAATVKTVEVPGVPVAQAFTDADVTWCREYNIASSRIVDETKAAGLPSNVAARDLPASAWTADERAENQRFVEYLGRWDAGLADLQSRVTHPTLKLLLDSMVAADGKLASALAGGTYAPSDYSYFRDGSAASGALGETCERLQP